MDFEFTDELQGLVHKRDFNSAVKLCEERLQNAPPSDFQLMIGRDMLGQSAELKAYIKEFVEHLSSGKAKSSLVGLFRKRSQIEKCNAIYCEMNGFSINPDRWFIDLFAYDKYGGVEDEDWLADFYSETSSSMTITGLEDLQAAFESYFKLDDAEKKRLGDAFDNCELLIVVRLQELMHKVAQELDADPTFNDIPLLATAHDFDFIYTSV